MSTHLPSTKRSGRCTPPTPSPSASSAPAASSASRGDRAAVAGVINVDRRWGVEMTGAGEEIESSPGLGTSLAARARSTCATEAVRGGAWQHGGS